MHTAALRPWRFRGPLFARRPRAVDTTIPPLHRTSFGSGSRFFDAAQPSTSRRQPRHSEQHQTSSASTRLPASRLLGRLPRATQDPIPKIAPCRRPGASCTWRRSAEAADIPGAEALDREWDSGTWSSLWRMSLSDRDAPQASSRRALAMPRTTRTRAACSGCTLCQPSTTLGQGATYLRGQPAAWTYTWRRASPALGEIACRPSSGLDAEATAHFRRPRAEACHEIPCWRSSSGVAGILRVNRIMDCPCTPPSHHVVSPEICSHQTQFCPTTLYVFSRANTQSVFDAGCQGPLRGILVASGKKRMLTNHQPNWP